MNWKHLVQLGLAAFVLALLHGNLAKADGLIIVDRAPSRTDHFAFAPLEVSYHHVEVDLDDRIATTRVDQEFFNPTSQRLEGTYIFPLPPGASIDRFSMDIDGRMAEAELLDAAKARSIYEEIVRKYRDPALMEYAGRGAMKVRIFPIEPHSKKRVQLRYTQVVKPDSGVVEYTYPLNTEKFSSKVLKNVSIKVNVSGSMPIKSIYCPTHEVTVRRDGDRRAAVGFEASNVRPDTDFKLMITRQPDPIGVNVMTWRDGKDGDGYFMVLASPGVDVPAGRIQPKDICFVLDTSGSMAGPKLEQAKKAMLFCLANLNPDDRFQVIRFSTETEPLFDSLVKADKSNIDKARQFVDMLKAIGGTAIDDALAKAIETGQKREQANEDVPYTIIFLTDGQPTMGEKNEDKIVQRIKPHDQKTRARVFPFGVGTDVNTTLLDRLANDTSAISQYVLPSEDIEVKVSSFYSKIQSPVLTNVKLEFTSMAVSDVRVSHLYPNVLPDLFKGETLVAFGRYQGSGDVRVQVSGTINGQSAVYATAANFAKDDTTHGFIPRLWATRRVGWLLDEIRLRGESKELKDEITSLARQHGIVTPYTAYLIMEDERRRAVPVTMQTMRELSADARARDDVARQYNSANNSSPQLQRAGELALDNANNLNSLKSGSQVQQAQQTTAMAKAPAAGRGGRGAEDAGYKVASNYAQQVRVVNGRSFYQNGNVWSDNTIQSKQGLKKQEIKFNSEDYFALLSRYPTAIPWFSLGNEVDVVIEDTLYVVR